MKKILLVEDDDLSARILTVVCKKHGFDVIRCLDAKQATKLFRKNEGIVLVLADFNLGGENLNADFLYNTIKDELAEENIVFAYMSGSPKWALHDKLAIGDLPFFEKWTLHKDFELLVLPLLEKIK